MGTPNISQPYGTASRYQDKTNPRFKSLPFLLHKTTFFHVSTVLYYTTQDNKRKSV